MTIRTLALVAAIAMTFTTFGPARAADVIDSRNCSTQTDQGAPSDGNPGQVCAGKSLASGG
jgi:hypothetical protein